MARRPSQKSIDYVLTHRFDSGWRLNQGYRDVQMDMSGQLANISSALTAAGNFNRNVLTQDFRGHSDGLDTYVSHGTQLAGVQHDVVLGIALMYDKLDKDSRRCAIAAQNIYKPVYGRPVTACAFQNDAGLTDTTLAQSGLYGGDTMALNDQWSLSLSLRHDRSQLKTINPLRPAATATTCMEKSADTGHAGLAYKASANLRPYVSYATSFLPQTGTTFDGAPIDPEQGKQTEAGLKFLSDDQRVSGGVAYYDLKRRNLAQTDDANPGYQIAIGEQRTQGYEAEIAADFKNGWEFSGALSLLDAMITEASASQAATLGQPLSNVPRKTANLLTNYRFKGGLSNWSAGVGVRYLGERTTTSATYVVPAYTVDDANLSYRSGPWRVQLNVKNLFYKDYFAGASNANWVPVGNPRTVLLKAATDF